MIFATPPPEPGPLRARLRAATTADELEVMAHLLPQAESDPARARRIAETARALVEAVRAREEKARRRGRGGMEDFLREYALSSEEGVVLMCLAEALLRIPDPHTADKLIRDKLGSADFEKHLGKSPSPLVNASTWAFMLTGKVIGFDLHRRDLGAVLRRLVARSGEPFIRQAITTAMRILGRQFVIGRTIEQALERAGGNASPHVRYSFDMLGEAARTARDSERYFDAYAHALDMIAEDAGDKPVEDAPGLSVKLSALHPRFELWQERRANPLLIGRVRHLAGKAKQAGLQITLDAEEAERLEPFLDVFEAVAADKSLAGWDGLGLAVQAYQKRARPLLDWLDDLADRAKRRLMVRLVKGAYWDTEIKRGQERGLSDYPVFTRKANTDVSYLACAARMLESPQRIYPQFATHNAQTVAVILESGARGYEFQRLHGMGEELYDELAERNAAPCRVYAPVGAHEDLLPYLVRRLLENGANTSFVNILGDTETPVAEIIADPVARATPPRRHPRIPLPPDLYMPERKNARGLDLYDPAALARLAADMERAEAFVRSGPIIGGGLVKGETRDVTDPADRRRTVGEVTAARKADVARAVDIAAEAAPAWDERGGAVRADILERAAGMLETEYPAFMRLCVREGGRTVPDALAEVREAVDFCRYFAARAREQFAEPSTLPGPTGEANSLSLHGRGVFACISPWNFPLAIFLGQVTAALAAGNAAIAKPAHQTPLIAAEAVRLLHRAGVPPEVLHLLPGSGPGVGMPLVSDARVAGVALTGSVATAATINRALAARKGPIVPFIAETGGQNTMIVDSSALPEQVVADSVASAFNSAGQRCSALRVLFLQSDVAGRMIEMLAGAMAELAVGDPGLMETDVGPVIDKPAIESLTAHAKRMARQGKLIYETPLPESARHGSFFAPRAFEITDLKILEREVFGPVLHVIRFEADKLDRVIEAVNATGFGLTLGIHSRIEETVEEIRRKARVGNIYVNRNMIGAVVGVQPFGGEGLSGTGPKTGGPHYVPRFAVERAVSVNTAATGGNAALMSLEEGPGRR